ncbi:hypothetical protein KBD45_01605 [Candidatus Dojkabacteria bacterium]|nr:hypothetical protein [Candidatus Dojkabacteria bacterium]
MDEIARIWEIHKQSKYPKGFGGHEIDGIDLTLLDCDIAGCVSVFLSHNHELDKKRIATLSQCYRDITIVLNKLSEPELSYFSRLEKLASLILKELSVV